MKKKEILCRVITFISRKELDFLDDLAKDLYFKFGKKVSRAKLIEMIIEEFKERGAEAKKELIKKILSLQPQLERRQYPRLKRNLEVGLRKLESLEEYQEGASENVSIGGLKIEVPSGGEPWSVQQVIELTLKDAAEQEPMKAFGRIVWLKEKADKTGFELGLRLTYIQPEDRQRFASYLQPEEKKNEINLTEEK